MRKYKCTICGYVYDESSGTKWEKLPDDFTCPLCGAPKSAFAPINEEIAPVIKPIESKTESLGDMSAGELSAICSNLAKGCEKQQLLSEMDAFTKLAEYFRSKTNAETATFDAAMSKLNKDMTSGFAAANLSAKSIGDRGALRSLVWSEKVSTMTKILLERFDKEGDAMLKDTKLWVCDICGFIYFGNTLPNICPVCKVPNHKILQVERR